LKKTNPNSSSKASLASEQYLYLTTRGRNSGQTREIEIWFTHCDGLFYVIAEYPTANWVQSPRADSQAQIRVAGRSMNARAHVLLPDFDSSLISAIQVLFWQKYGWGGGTRS
jgi:hypothetical protein